MTREQAKQKLDYAAEVTSKTALQSATLFYQDVITKRVECRRIYAHEYLELTTWIEDVIDNLPRDTSDERPAYAGYIDRNCCYSHGTLHFD